MVSCNTGEPEDPGPAQSRKLEASEEEASRLQCWSKTAGLEASERVAGVSPHCVSLMKVQSDVHT